MVSEIKVHLPNLKFIFAGVNVGNAVRSANDFGFF